MASTNRPAPRTLSVLDSFRITPNMIRVVLGGEGMAEFPANAQGGYIKLRLGEGIKPMVRSYTIRNQRLDAIDVDFAVHGEAGGAPGPAVAWALAAQPGDTISIGGPGPAKPLPPGMDRYVIAGDMTALPAMTVNLETLADDAQGVAVIEIADEGDRQDIACPPGMELHWLINPAPGTRPDMLADHLRSFGWGDGETYGWAAAEFSAMRALRAYLRDERGLGRDRLYISSYWKHGAVDEVHREAKRSDAEVNA